MRHHGEGSVFKRGRVWYVQYTHNGEVIQRSSKSTDKTTAVRFLHESATASPSVVPLQAAEG